MFNKQIFSGRLTTDPELQSTKSGKSVCNVFIGVDYFTVEDSGTGDTKKHTVFPKLTFWGKNAETLARYRKKGEVIFVETHMEADQWWDPVTRKDIKNFVFVVDRFHLEDNRGKYIRGKKDETKLEEIGDADGDLPF